MWDEFGHNSGRLFPLSILNQENPDTEEDYPSKGEGTPAILEMQSGGKGEGTDGMENVFQLSCCSKQRGFVPRFHVL